MAFLFVLKYVLSTCKTLFLESCTASTTMFSLLIPYLAPFFGIFHPRHQITGGNITYIHSTHTPHVGRDYLQISPSYQFGHFYSHASCEARHDPEPTPEPQPTISTHTPHAGRDRIMLSIFQPHSNFYSYAPCGARHLPEGLVLYDDNFYSHASCEARLEIICFYDLTFPDFYSHASCEARLPLCYKKIYSDHFYSLASCEARPGKGGAVSHRFHFYSHASCEARLLLLGNAGTAEAFLLTRLLRGATCFFRSRFQNNCISTHTPLARRDLPESFKCLFQQISTHTPLARRDVVFACKTCVRKNFYSHASCEARRHNYTSFQNKIHFYSHASCEARHDT